MQLLLLRSDLNELPRLANFARSVGRDTGQDQDRIFALELCLEEAVANIILHGNSDEPAGKQIWVTITDNADSLVACIEDNGTSFDPTQLPAPPVPTSLEDASVGGLGVHLIRKFTSDMRYERVDGRNRLILVFAPRGNGADR